MAKMMFKVDDMSCQNCVKHVTEAIQGVTPGATVDVDLKSGDVAVTGPAVDAAAVIKAVKDAGYPARAAD